MASLLGSARSGALAIELAYDEYRRAFESVTQRASERFALRQWAAAQHDAHERLELYKRAIDVIVTTLELSFGDQLREASLWRAMRGEYAEAIARRADAELAETFFNSVTRRIFVTVGVDPRIEFVDLDLRRDRYGHGSVVHRSFRGEGARETVLALLDALALPVPYAHPAGDAALIARRLRDEWRRAGHRGAVEALEVIDAVFYRGSGAYVVGRAVGGGDTMPLVLALCRGAHGAEVDAILCTERDVSIVFSYTRAHFMVALERPADVIRFLRSILPKKRVAELYICLGYPKHGKTELYRDLTGHLRRSMDRFEHAAGDTGLVMIVFTLPSFDYVFKVIRDTFAPPKTSTRAEVVSRYQLVFRHDRAGRLIEAQEFEHLIIDRHRFTPALLEELSRAASRTVTLEEDQVHIRHVYVERRVQPLNLFLRQADEHDALRAVIDYGRAIRDLATTNIFPGDLLLKNFGVTRHGRVTFYDYDELCLVTECVFRALPKPRDGYEETAAEPWFYVGEHDVFPEEFLHFMGLDARQREAFLGEHAEVLTPDYWRHLQERHQSGDVLDVFPYPPSRRLRP